MTVLAVHHYMLAFLFLLADTWGQNGISIRVKYTSGNSNYFVSVGFSSTLFKAFYACLCGGQAMSCAAYYTVRGSENYPVHVVYKEGSVNQNFSSPIPYTCLHSASSSRLICNRLMASFDEITERMQYFRLISSQGCISDCVGFIWFFEGEEIHSNNVNSDFQTCNKNCNCPASAVATSTPAITTPGTSHSDLTDVTMTQVTIPLTAATSEKETRDEKAPLGLIIGVAVAGIIVAVVIVIGVVFWRRRRRKTMNKAGKGRRSKNSSVPLEETNNRTSESMYTETNFSHDNRSTPEFDTIIDNSETITNTEYANVVSDIGDITSTSNMIDGGEFQTGHAGKTPSSSNTHRKDDNVKAQEDILKVICDNGGNGRSRNIKRRHTYENNLLVSNIKKSFIYENTMPVPSFKKRNSYEKALPVSNNRRRHSYENTLSVFSYHEENETGVHVTINSARLEHGADSGSYHYYSTIEDGSTS